MHTTIERLSKEACAHVERELSALIGTELEFSLQSASLIKKQEFLANLSGRHSIIGLQMRGRYEGAGCLVVAEDCAVRLAGKMLMLPSTELNDIISAGSYSDEEEISYAFDDIAKCLIISFLHTFQYNANFISSISCQSQKFAEGKKETAEVLSHLSPDQTYYVVSTAISLAGVISNSLSLLLPAFVLVCSDPFKKQTGTEHIHSLPEDEILIQDQAYRMSSECPEDTVDSGGDPLFPFLRPVLQKELSTLLGVTVQTREKTNLSGSGRGLPRGTTTHPQLITRISISGAVQNNGWLITGTRDAMKLGLLLTEGVPGLMIPGSLAGDFNVDCQDGYQEISSIIIDAIDLVCNDLSEGEMFVEKEALVEEAELQFESGDRVDDNEQMYRRTSVELVADTLVCGTIQILLPAELYENLKTAAPGHSLETVGDHQEDSINPYVLTDAAVESGPSERSDHAAAVLLIEDSSAHVPEILNSFEQAGIKGVSVSTTDDVSRTDLDSYRAVVLVLERLDEIGFGVVIKIKSSSSVPLLVAASSWTQTEVMKAMRFGVDDIIMLPIEGDELVHTLRERDLLNV